MWNSLVLFSVLLMVGPAYQQTSAPTAPATPAAPSIPPEALHRINPVKPTPAGQAQAIKTYGYDCAVCHGATGNGKGDLAVQMKMNLKDWTDPATLQGKTDGELFYIITNGQGQMPPEGPRATPDNIWNLVVLVRGFAKK